MKVARVDEEPYGLPGVARTCLIGLAGLRWVVTKPPTYLYITGFNGLGTPDAALALAEAVAEDCVLKPSGYSDSKHFFRVLSNALLFNSCFRFCIFITQ